MSDSMMDMDTEELPPDSGVDQALEGHLDDPIIFSEAQLAESLCETHNETQLTQTIDPNDSTIIEVPALLVHTESVQITDVIIDEHTLVDDGTLLTEEGGPMGTIEEPLIEPLPPSLPSSPILPPPPIEEIEPPCSCLTCQNSSKEEGVVSEEPSVDDPSKAKCLICYATIASPLLSSIVTSNVGGQNLDQEGGFSSKCGDNSQTNIGSSVEDVLADIQVDSDSGVANSIMTSHSNMKSEIIIDSENDDSRMRSTFISKDEDPKVKLSLIFQILSCSIDEIDQDVGLLDVVPLCVPCHSVVTDAIVIFQEIQKLEKTLGNLKETIKDQIVKSFEANFCKKKKSNEETVGLMSQIDATRRAILSESISAAKILSSLKGSKKGGAAAKKKKTIVSKAALYPQVTLEPINTGRKKRKRTTKTQAKVHFDDTSVKQECPSDHDDNNFNQEFPYEEEEYPEEDDDEEVIQTHSGRLVKKPNYKKWFQMGDDDDEDEEEEIKPEGIDEEVASPKSEPEWSPGHTDDELGDRDFDSDDDTSEDSDLDLESEEELDDTKKELDEFGVELVGHGEEYIDPETGEKKIRTTKKRKQSTRVKCPECSRTFADENRRDVHIKRKHQEGGEAQIYSCDKCSKQFRRPGLLRKHLEKQHGEIHDGDSPGGEAGDKKRHMCDFCGQKYRNASELRIHVRLHTGETPYSCEHCEKSFVSSLKREFHIEQSHWEVPPLKCEFCPKAFFRQHRLRIHRISHTGEKAYLCEICSQSFSHPTYLKYHQGQHAELNLETFKCKDCGKTFANPTNLRLHVKTVHLKQFRFTCEVCSMGFTHMSHKRIHMRGHTGERPYKCDLCNESFRYRDRLRIHMRGHTGERPFVCELCKKGFASRSKLKRHEKIHEKNQPPRPQSMEEIEQAMRHRCDDCGKGFAEPQHLSAHRRYCQRKVSGSGGDKEERAKSSKSAKVRAASTVVQVQKVEQIIAHQPLQPQQPQMLVPVPVTYTYPVTYGYEVTQAYHQPPPTNVREYPNYN